MSPTFAAQLLLLTCTPVLAWFLVVYRLKLLMYAAGIALMGLSLLMALPLEWPGKLALRIALWIGREIEEHG